MQNIVLLGATGSIGDQTLDIIRRYPEEFRIVAMSANSSRDKLIQLCEEFECPQFFLREIQTEDHKQIASCDDLVDKTIDHLIVADHGLGCLASALKALTLKKRVSIANKELLIAHGEDIMYLAREQQAEVIPLDSEHNAIFQCLRGEKLSDLRRIIITASGGPFRDKDPEELQAVTIDQVLNHPNWSMGNKTTVDSATLVNKAFEIIEAHHLFGIPYDKIEVRLHPESIIHAIVEFNDGSSKILAYKPDMRFSLGYALFYPERAPESLTGSDDDFFDYDRDLHLSKIEPGRFPCFDYVLETAKTKPNALRQLMENDSEAVNKFLHNDINFVEIEKHLKSGI